MSRQTCIVSRCLMRTFRAETTISDAHLPAGIGSGAMTHWLRTNFNVIQYKLLRCCRL